MHDADVTERKKGESAIKVARAEALGRWPANVVHDGSDEVVAAFPETTSGDHKQYRQNVKGWKNSCDVNTFENKGDSGSASRFFYSAKASKHDRAGSKHPTVKPISLMRWLCRLVTPKGGTILDPFAGSGTTGAAAHLEGFRAILCEQDETYQDDIVNRLQEFSNDTPDPIIDPTDLTQCTSYEDQE
jgi:site-specific DNA-methyltransferase (adenine-specific)